MSAYVVKRRRARGLSYHFAAILASAVVLAFSGAYDTDNLTLVHRLTLFATVCGLLIGQASFIDGWLRRFFSEGLLPSLFSGVLTVGLTLIFMTFEVHALKYTPLLPKAPDPLLEFALFLAPFVVAGAGLVAFLKSPAAGRLAEIQPIEIGVERVLELSFHPVIAGFLPPPDPEQLAGWPDEPVLRIVSQDHYLEVTTASGTSFIRGRMRDALARLADREGVRPHRSWWVSVSEVSAIGKRGRDRVLELRDGAEAPVARGRWKQIKARLPELDPGV